MTNAKPRISVDYRDDITVVRLMNEKILETEDIQGLESSIMPLVEQTGPIKLVVDFSAVKFLSSAVLGVLIRVSKRVYETGGELALCGLNSKILQVFKVTRLEKIFAIHPDAEKAVAFLRQSS